MTTSPIELVEVVAAALESLREEVVFVGGAITGLLLTDPAAPSTSSTKDVDIIVSVTTRAAFLDGLGQRMRALGFREDTEEDAPICRWRLANGIKLDLMPTDPSILGFSNRWFPGAFRAAQPHELPSGTLIRIVTAPYFLATKFEAFLGRGGADYMASKDMEDIVAVLHGREEIVEEIASAAVDIREYLVERAEGLSSAREFEVALAGHLPGEDTNRVMQRVAQIVALRDDAGD